MCEISRALKITLWIVLSLLLHASIAAVLWLSEGDALPEHDVEVVDLTLAPVNVGTSGAPPRHPEASNRHPETKSKDLTPTKSTSQGASMTVADASLDSSAAPQNDEGSTQNDEGFTARGQDGDGGALGWKEVTRLPKVLKEVKAIYPASAKQAQVAGAVVLDIVIDREGKVVAVHLVNGPGHGLNESAAEALRQFQFSPAYKEDKSVAVKIRYTYRFKLDVN